MNVLIIQRMIPDYRMAFFQSLHSKLASDGISLKVLTGVGRQEEFLQDTMGNMSFATRTRNVSLLGESYWTLHSWEMASHSDMVIVEQAVAPLQNIAFVLRRETQSLFRRGHHPLIAFWGHGMDLAPGVRHRLADGFKRLVLTKADWWFAYTSRSQQYVIAAGYPRDRVTNVNNSTDVDSLRNALFAVSKQRMNQLFRSLFPQDRLSSCMVAMFCSRLIERKDVPLMLKSAGLIHNHLPSFRLIIIGDGPFRSLVQEFCNVNDWCVFVGKISGLARAPYLKMSDVWLCPGGVGLEVIDAFAAGLPFCTTWHDRHSPEVVYISNGINGLITKQDATQYSDAVAKLLSSDAKLRQMKSNAARDSKQYGIEQMANRFRIGILQCLKHDT